MVLAVGVLTSAMGCGGALNRSAVNASEAWADGRYRFSATATTGMVTGWMDVGWGRAYVFMDEDCPSPLLPINRYPVPGRYVVASGVDFQCGDVRLSFGTNGPSQARWRTAIKVPWGAACKRERTWYFFEHGQQFCYLPRRGDIKVERIR